MWVIRFALALLFGALVILIDLPLHLITWLIEKNQPGSCTRFRHDYARFGMKGIWFLAGGDETVIGLEKVPTDRPVLFVGNHRSIFDILLAGSLIDYPVGFVAKKELRDTPIRIIMDKVQGGRHFSSFPRRQFQNSDQGQGAGRPRDDREHR